MYGPGDVAFFDRIPSLYDLFMPATDPEPIRRAFEAADRPVTRLIDLGGGTGRGAQALDAPTDPDERLVVDISMGMLRRARTAGLSAVAGDARSIPAKSGTVDTILVVDAFHHMPDVATVLDECARALAPGGVLVIRDFDPGTVRGGVIALSERVVGFGSTFRGPDEVVATLESAGFDARAIERGFTYTVVGTAPDSETD